MKYFEKTKKEILQEMWINNGSMGGSAIVEFFSDITDYKDVSKLAKLTKKYFEEVVGTSLKKYGKNDLKDYIESLGSSYMEIKNLPMVVENKDVISNLAFYLSKDILKMREGIGCSYVIYKKHGDLKYYFFDNELEELFGYISLRESRFSEVKKYCGSKNIYQVSTSMSDKEFQGTGIGKNMYLTLIDKFGCLASDSSLFHSSLNIWVNVLPKYFDVYYVDDGRLDKDTVVPMSIRPRNWNNVEFIFAVNK